jgi:hypothetical protein
MFPLRIEVVNFTITYYNLMYNSVNNFFVLYVREALARDEALSVLVARAV